MRSWLLPPNKSPSVTLPVGPSKTYSFSILTQGSLRRLRFSSSRSFENFFSFTRSFLRATSHSFCETTLRFSIPRTVLILGINVLSVGCYCCDSIRIDLSTFRRQLSTFNPQGFGNVHSTFNFQLSTINHQPSGIFVPAFRG